MKKLLTTVTLLLCTLLTGFAQFSGSGSGTESDPYRIFNADQLTQLRNFLNQEGVYFKLQNDINIAAWLTDNYPSQGWQPVGSSSEPFKGVLDGNGKTISGFSINRSSTDYVGLFGYISGATIKNLTIEGNVTGHDYVGAFVGGGTFNVANTLTGLTHIGATAGNYRVGGIAGVCGGNISNLTVNGNVTGSYHDVGGAIGNSGEAIGSISGVTVTGDVKNTSSSSTATGGIIGYTYINMSNASYSGNVTGGKDVGGIIGCAKGVRTFSNLTATGKVTGSGSGFCGGICGKSDDGLTLTNGSSHCDVTGKQYTGGIIGGTESGSVNLTSCYAEGDIIGTTSVGGICGQIKNPDSSSISGCNYWGDISGTSQLGGVVGSIITTHTESFPNFTTTTTAGYKAFHFTNYNSIRETYLYNTTSCFYNSNPSFGHYTYSSSSHEQNYQCYIIRDYIASDIEDWAKSYHSVEIGEKKYIQAIYVVFNNIRTTTDINIYMSISNCSAVGNITGTSAYVGGMIGQDIDGNNASYSLSRSKTVRYYEGDGTNSSTTSLTLKEYSYTYTTTNVTESYFSGNLTGTNYIGGIAGAKQGGCINKCYASATINGNQYVGGIAGYLSKESLNTNENSLNANVSICPSITGTSNVGRIYGSTDGNFSVAALGTTSENRSMASTQVVTNGVTQTITDDLQNGAEVGVSQLRLKAHYVGLGWDFNNNWTIQETESFPYKTWQTAPPTFSGNLTSGSTTIRGKSIDGGIVYLATSSGKTYTTTCSGSNWSVSVDALHAGETVTAYAAGTNKEKSYFTTTTVGYLGSGTEADPYQIASAEDLQGIYTGGYYKIMNDINLTSWINQYSPTEGWLPVGYDGAAVYIDGDGHKISGLWTNSTGTYTGLFSKFKDGYIKNLNVEVASGKKVKGGAYTGILIAYASNFEISNCSVKGNAEGTTNVGGFAGYFSGNSSSHNLTNLTYDGTLSSGINIGGIAGHAESCRMTKALSNAQISSTSSSAYIGGLMGTMSGLYVSQSTANVNIIASGTSCKVGGLFGSTGSSSSASISETYSIGTIKVSGSNSWSGGIAGALTKNCQLSDSYSTVTISGTQYTAGLVGQASSASKINRCYATGNLTGVYFGAGIVGYLNDSNTQTTNCVALNNILSFTDQSSWASRVIGGYDEASGDPDGSNLALATMQVSLNNVPVTKYDDLVEGFAKSEAELKQQATYAALGWDFDEVWTMPADGYHVLKWQAEASSSVMIGDLTGDGRVSITDIVMMIDVIAGIITDANQKAAADVNGDGNVSITDCVAAIDLIAAQGSTANSARRKAQAMLSNTDFISGAMEDNLLTISLDNERHYTAFQMIVSVPEGMALGKATMDEMRGADHRAIVRDLGGGQYLVAGFSSDNDELAGNSGSLLSVVTNGQATGDIVISDIEFATTKAEAYYLADIAVSSTPTGIESIVNDEMVNGKWYDLQGRRVTKTTKGIYIYNGKKTIIK